MRAVDLALVVFLLSPAEALAEAAVAHGTLPDGSDSFLHESNHATAAEAVDAVLNRCKQDAADCRLEAQFKALCFAMAYGDPGFWAHATGVQQSDANRAALSQCSSSGQACQLIITFCDTANAQQPRTAEKQQQDSVKPMVEIDRKNEEQKAQLLQLAEAQKLQAEKNEREQRDAFERNLAACKSYKVDACDGALGFAKITDLDRTQIADARNLRIALLENRKQCEDGSSDACRAALHSPALFESERAPLQHLYEQSSLSVRASAFVSLAEQWAYHSAGIARQTLASLPELVAASPPSTLIVSAIALTFGLATLVFVWLRSRSARSGPRSQSANSSMKADFTVDPAGRARPSQQQTTDRPQSAPQPPSAAQARSSQAASPSEPVPTLGEDSSHREIVPSPSPPPPMTDPVTAKQALRLASSYFAELDGLGEDLGESEKLAAHRSTMALATKQLDIAMRADPSANFEEVDKDGNTISMTQARMRAMLLCQEAISYIADKPSKTTAFLKRATEIDPEFWYAHYSLGTHQFDRRNKTEAIAALERALFLDPEDIDTIKALDRARNMSAVEAVTFKASRAAETTMAAGIKTFNGFIFAWNVFAITYNVVTFPIRIMLRLFGIVDRVWK